MKVDRMFTSEQYRSEAKRANLENQRLFNELCKVQSLLRDAQEREWKHQSEIRQLKHKISSAESKVNFLEGSLKKSEESLKKSIEDNKKLSKELNKRNGKENPYGSSTPSSKQVDKKNSSKENRGKKGGGSKGHKGYGRKKFTEEEADRVEYVKDSLPKCTCSGDMISDGINERCCIRYIPGKMEKVLYRQKAFKCSCCRKSTSGNPPDIHGVMPGHTYANDAIGHMMAEHYFHGTTAGKVAKRWGMKIGTFFHSAHKTTELLSPLFDNIVKNIRSSPVIFADETPWSNDGRNGYAWFFGNDSFRIFVFRQTRGSIVPLNILGEKELNGILITDRYIGYVSKIPIRRQYCYVHILRDIKDLGEEFPDEKEVQFFVNTVKILIAKAVSFRNDYNGKSDFRKKAEELKDKIMREMNKEALHPGVQKIQNLFRENESRLFQWCKSEKIPADNNYAETAVKNIVIPRKISFGSQSEKGLNTREKIMTVLHTAKCYKWEPGEFLAKTLNALQEDPTVDLFHLMTNHKAL